MIEIKNLCKSFGEKVIFKDFNEKINDGEFVIFAGRSGCGKTTLLNLIGALEKPDGGVITVDGRDINNGRTQREYFSTKVGFLFQNFALLENKSVQYNLSLIPAKNRTQLPFSDALKQVGLEGREKTLVYKLSGGEQQRVALARLMVKKCELILADEPTGSLDSANADVVLNILKKLNADGKTVILVTHDERIIRSGERVIRL